MTTELRPGLPTEAYQLGSVVGAVRPSLWMWAVGILPAVGWCVGLMIGGAVFAWALMSEPFAFLLNMGWAAFLLPILLPIGGLYILGCHLFRNLRGLILVLDGGVVLVPGARGKARVYPWSGVRSVRDGNHAPPSQSEAESANVFAHGRSQFTAHMGDGVWWVFGSDLRGFAELREWFRQKGKVAQEAVTPAEPPAGGV